MTTRKKATPRHENQVSRVELVKRLIREEREAAAKHKLVPSQQQMELIQKVSDFGESTRIACIEMIRENNVKGFPTGPIFASPKTFPHPYDDFISWPLEEVRSLWNSSTEYIPGAVFVAEDRDGGYVSWLWTKVQTIWSLSATEAVAINPIQTWVNALTPNKSTPEWLLPVSANPMTATAKDVLRVAAMASRIGQQSLEIEKRLKHLTLEMYDSLKLLAEFSMNHQKIDHPKDYELSRWQLECGLKRDTGNYERASWERMEIATRHKVVEKYERALLPETALKRPPLIVNPANCSGAMMDYPALLPHLQRVALELENHAHSMIAVSLVADEPTIKGQGEWESKTKKKWRTQFCWSEQTMRNRIKSFPAAFREGTNTRSCSIDPEYVKRWTAEAMK
jgi:hypothetical protein